MHGALSLLKAIKRTVARLNIARRTRMAGLFLLALVAAWPLALQAADDDLPARVGRVADLAGQIFIAPQDQPESWTAIGLNYPIAAGDNVWVGREGRVEIDIGAGQFRLGPGTSLHLARLDDRQFALFIAQGKVSLRVRVLDPGETAQVDTPNAQVVLTRPGLYRLEVSADHLRTLLAVREGEANVQSGDAVAQVLPGQSATVAGAQPTFAAIANGIANDGFDTWVVNRERYYDRSRTNSYVSRQMVGWADLEEYGTWDQLPEYGAIWYPAGVAADWAPYRNGYWTDVGAWGPTWVDYAPWGYAPFHYGRWAYVRGRWGWCPGTYVARPAWAPALVGWTGGPGWTVSTAHGAPVYGWVPLAWGEAYRPWWGRCSHGCWDRYNRPYAVDVAVRPTTLPSRYVNWNAPGGMSAMAGSMLRTRTPVQANLINISPGMMSGVPLLATAPVVRPDPGRIPGGRTPGQGAPPPASTFYPTLARPAVPAGGLGTLPGGAASGVVPPRRPIPAGPSPSGPANVSRPAPAPMPGGPATAGNGMGESAVGTPMSRPSAAGVGPIAPGAMVRVPPVGATTLRPPPMAGSSSMPGGQPPVMYAPAAPASALVAPSGTRPITRSLGTVPPSLSGQGVTPLPIAPPVQLSRPAAPLGTLARPAPTAPMMAPQPHAAAVMPAPVAPAAPGGNDAGVARIRNGNPAIAAPVPDKPRPP